MKNEQILSSKTKKRQCIDVWLAALYFGVAEYRFEMEPLMERLI